MTETVASTTDTELSCYEVVLVTRDGEELAIPCDSGTTLLEAAEQAGVVLKSSCQSGACGSCSGVIAAGQVEMGKHDPGNIAVPESEGGILLCCSTPRGNCRIELPYDRDYIVAAPPARHQARITGLERVADAVMHLKLTVLDEAGGPGSADFEAGQFVRITVPGTDARRAYSLANVSNWDGELEFYVRLLPGGVMSEYLTARADVGDVLTVSGPQGAFTLAENGLRPRWFIAGGTGLSPLLSMLRRMAEWGDLQPARLFFGLTRRCEVYAQDALTDLTGALPGFRADTVVWQPDPEWTGATGNPVDVAAAEVALLDEMPDVYVCGPPPMVDAAFAALTAAGVPREQIHSESFFTSG
ncbi:FAD-binding oxidoreductase [Nocardia vaccinii]|uniref:FAD-binding oxidoreductase n=1 Tax=Nocardia vaccinii TaxID=1822 RepID=UPI00082ED23B|nr:2Fe-2S iron-sulfur cluster binding domain-containing protein [Nocardia vaccinii]